MADMKKLLTFEVPTDEAGYGELSLEALGKIQTLAVQAAAPLREKGIDEVTDDDVALLQELAAVTKAVRAQRAKREQRMADYAQATAETAPDETVEEPDAVVPDPAKPGEPGGPGGPDAPESEESDEKTPKSPPKGKAFRVADAAKGTKIDPPQEDVDDKFFALLAAADLPGYSAGAEIDMVDVGRAVEKRMSAYIGRQGGYARHGVAVFKRQFPADVTQGRSDDDESLIDYAARESRLPGGSVWDSVEAQVKAGTSLTAAAGWCAPSQTLYDLFELESGNDGMLDLPEIQVTRGGIRFTPGPDFASIYGGTGYFHQTEAQVIAATTKPCMVVPCPSFTDVRLEIEGVCITGSILQSRGYPEMVARFVRGAMAVHRRKMNQFIIAAVVAGSTTVDLSPHPTPAAAAADDTSATTVLLAHLEMAAVDYKYRHRMPARATLEAVLPMWALPVLRADLSRRTGVMLENVTDEFLVSQMRARGVRPQFVMDWQDSFAGLAAGPGGATALTQFPTEMEFLLYAAGTFVRGSADVITLDTVYDAANLALNQYTALFTEEGVLVAKRGHDARRYIVPFCPTGATSATNAINCA